MVKSGIKIFTRLRPTKKATGLYEVGEYEDGTASISITLPRSEASGVVNNKKEIYTFRYNRVFDQESKQDEVFELVARGVIDNCLEGYNGTIFAYGQTGSGKTFTITGGAERYTDRGIIPRTLSYLFQQYQKAPGTIYTTHISYLEIYNENGYDLLDPKHEASKLEDLPKVTLLEDREGSIHLKNLSLHQSTNEEEALNWLFLGDTNRMIAETPMNMASTRSHCIFTIHISSREPGSDTIRRAKLHLVDLAGSERVGKTGMGGTLLTEAKYINLSLHYLEQVIVALSEKSRSHIPYRNSMMTSVLRDSLGGNCMTSMIATCSVEKRNIEETVSTCRFSQRVALVKNEAILNEELDPKLMVTHLKQRVQELKDELAMATGEERSEELTQEERDKCRELVDAYLQDTNPETQLLVGGDMRKIQLCFQIMKAATKRQSQMKSTADQNRDEEEEEEETGVVSSDTELQKLRDLLKQRDDEISILLKMLKQEKRRAAEAEATLKDARVETKRRVPSPILGRTSPIQTISHSLMSMNAPTSGSSSLMASRSGVSNDSSGGHVVSLSRGSQESVRLRAVLKEELSQARQEAFDSFRRNYADTSAIDQHKKMLKLKYAEAKSLGERVNTSRVNINRLKSRIEQHRVARGVQGLSEGSSVSSGPDPKEEELKKEIEEEKANFKVLYGHLRDQKTEIEHIQHLLEKAKVQLQKDFEEWWTQQTTQGKAPVLPPTRSAWRTPPSSSSTHTTTDPGGPTPRPSSSRRNYSRQIAATFAGEQNSATHMSTGSSIGGLETLRTRREKVEVSAADPLNLRNKVAENNPLFGRGSQHQLSTPLSDGGIAIPSVGSSTRSQLEIPYYVRQPGSLPKVGEASHPLTQPPQALFGGSKAQSPPHSRHQASSIPLTGDSRADADILAFYKARQKLIQKGQPRR